jgi:hypothetical protein
MLYLIKTNKLRNRTLFFGKELGSPTEKTNNYPG